MSTLVLIDSMDHYQTAQAYTKWYVSPTVIASQRTGAGLKGSGGVKVFNLLHTITAGVAVNAYNVTANPPMLTLYNPITDLYFTLHLLSDSRFNATFGGIGDFSTSSSSLVTVVREGYWFYLELQVTFSYDPVTHVHTATFSVRVNEETILSDTIAWTKRTGEYGVTQWIAAGGNNYYDDLYITDTEFLGDIRIYVIRPNGVGDEDDWAKHGAATAWEATDDVNPDFDTTYISSDTVGQKAMVQLEDISLTGEIKGIQFNTVCEKDDAGGCAFKQYNKISDTIVEGASDIYPSYANWLDQVCPMRENPVTGLDFTVDEINAIQAGVERTI